MDMVMSMSPRAGAASSQFWSGCRVHTRETRGICHNRSKSEACPGTTRDLAMEVEQSHSVD
jgi:hypothetical protein